MFFINLTIFERNTHTCHGVHLKSTQWKNIIPPLTRHLIFSYYLEISKNENRFYGDSK